MTATTPVPTPADRLRRSAETLLVAVIDRAAGAVADQVDHAAGRLEDVAASPGVGLGAAFGAGTAVMTGGNPAWGAVKGAFGALSTPGKVGVVALLVLLALLSPVALLVALIVLLVGAIVRAAS